MGEEWRQTKHLEMGSCVKKPVLASSFGNWLPNKILMAMDVTLEKIEKLPMISTLCHHLAENHCELLGGSIFGANFQSVPEKEAVEILGELVSCQKDLSVAKSSSSELLSARDISAKAERERICRDEANLLLLDILERIAALKDSGSLETANLLTWSSSSSEVSECFPMDYYNDPTIAGEAVNWMESTSEKIVRLQLALVALPISAFQSIFEKAGQSQENEESKETFQMQNLAIYLSNFYDVASTMFANKMGNNTNTQSRNLIRHQLLKIKEQKLQSEYDSEIAEKSSKNKELDNSISEWKETVEKTSKEVSRTIKDYIKEQVTSDTLNKKEFLIEETKIQTELKVAEEGLKETVDFVRQCTKSLRARRHYLEASLRALIRDYEKHMLTYQKKLDELQVQVELNAGNIAIIEKRFKHVEENYDEMRAMRRLKELLKNMEKAEAIKQNWAARKIQVAWRKYKIAKLRKKKLKGKRKGKKKTPPPQQGKGSTTPSGKGSNTSASRSRSKSQTP